jgi:hypothetical protein
MLYEHMKEATRAISSKSLRRAAAITRKLLRKIALVAEKILAGVSTTEPQYLLCKKP